MNTDRRIAFERFSSSVLIGLINFEALEREGHARVARRYLAATIRLRALECAAAVLGERYCFTLRATLKLARRQWTSAFHAADPILSQLPAERMPDYNRDGGDLCR